MKILKIQFLICTVLIAIVILAFNFMFVSASNTGADTAGTSLFTLASENQETGKSASYILSGTETDQSGNLQVNVISTKIYGDGWLYAGFIDDPDIADTKYKLITYGLSNPSSLDQFKTTQFPACVSDNMIKKDWEIAAGSKYMQSYVCLPSKTEILNSQDAIDVIVNKAIAENHYILTRTDNTYGGFWAITNKGGGYMPGTYGVSQYYFLFECVLNKDFFKTVKLDVSNMGDNVKELITTYYTRSELSDLYTYAELSEIGYPEKYQIDALYSDNDIKAGTDFNFSVKFENNSNECIKLLRLISVLYDNNGKVYKMFYDEDSDGVDGNSESLAFSHTITVSENKNYYLATFALTEDFVPLCKAKYLNDTEISYSVSDVSSKIDAVFDINAQKLSINGKINNCADKCAFVYVLNQGKTIADLKNDSIENVFSYEAVCLLDGEGKYATGFTPDASSVMGKYTAGIIAEGASYTDEFVNIDAENESRLLSRYNSAQSAQDMIDITNSNAELLAYDNNLFNEYKNDPIQITKAFTNVLRHKPYASTNDITTEINRELALLKLCNVNDVNDFINKINQFNTYINMNISAYISSSTPADVVKDIYSRLLNINYENVDDLYEQFVKSAILTKINAVADYTGIKNVLLSERTALENFGIKMSIYDSLSDSSKFDRAITMIYSNWDDFETKFNTQVLYGDNEVNHKTSDSSTSSTSSKTKSGGGSSPKSSGVDMGLYIPETKTVPENKPKVNFIDINEALWAENEINYLAENGFISGNGNNAFEPNRSITREEFVKIVISAFNLTDKNSKSEFDDVPTDRWSYIYVSTAKGLNIVSGTGNRLFGAKSNITREDACVVLHNLVKNVYRYSGDTDMTPFDDESEVSDYAKEAVAEFKGLGIANGKMNNMFCPKDNLTRAEAAKVIVCVLQKVQNGGQN